MTDKRTIMEMHPEQRPDEKFAAYGPAALSDSELLSIILRTGSAGESAVELADRILRSPSAGEKNILNILNYELEDLTKIRGVGRVKALKILAACELSRRIAMTSAKCRLTFRDPKTIAEYYMEQLRHQKREVVLLLLLDSACHLIKEKTISMGTVNKAPLSPREIFVEALKYEAVSIILLHNHPSGDPSPSKADIECTKKIRKAGKLIGIELLDHIIIGDRTYISLNDEK